MSGPAVTIIGAGGLPVTPVGAGAPLLTAVASGGLAVTFADSAAPFVVQNAINLNFANGVVPQGADFERASTASYFDSAGELQAAAIDTPRFDYDPVTLAARGLLIEPAGGNLLAYSQDFDNPFWSLASVVVTPNATLAPDGSMTADLLTPGATNGLVYRGESLSAGETYTFSVWLRSATGGNVAMQLAYNGSGASPNPKTQNITVTPAWQRFELPMTSADGGTANVILGGYDGPWQAGGNVYAWGAQLEASVLATSYMPTSGGLGVRAADELSFTIPAGVNALRYTFDDGSAQSVTVSPGAYTVPTNLDRPHLKSIVGTP